MADRTASAPGEALTRSRLDDLVSDVERATTLFDVVFDACFSAGRAGRKDGVGREKSVGWWLDAGYTVLILTKEQESALFTAQTYADCAVQALDSAVAKSRRDPIA